MQAKLKLQFHLLANEGTNSNSDYHEADILRLCVTKWCPDKGTFIKSRD
jgi:hypothetical protein